MVNEFVHALLRGDFSVPARGNEEHHALQIARSAHAEQWSRVLKLSDLLPSQPNLRGLVLAHRSAALVTQGNPNEAVILLRQITRLSHASLRGYAHRLLGGVLILLGHLDEAQAHLTQALNTPLELERSRAHRDLGVLLARQGQYEEAESHYLKALVGLQGVSRALTLNNLAYLEVRRLAAKEALAHLEEALKLPGSKCEQARLWRTRHTAHLLRGESAQAMYALERSQGLADTPLVRAMTVHALRLTGERTRAKRVLERSLHDFLESPELQLAQAALLSGQQPAEALTLLESLNPTDPADGVRASLFKAHALHTLGRFEESYHCLGEATLLQAQHPLPFTLEAAHLSALYAWGLLHGLSLPLAWEGIVVKERPRVELFLDGVPRLQVEGREVELPPLAFHLLGYLWLEKGQCFWERLAMALWPETDDPKVLRSRLDNTLSRLRRRVGFPLLACTQGVCRFAPEVLLKAQLDDPQYFLEGCYLDWAVEVRQNGLSSERGF